MLRIRYLLLLLLCAGGYAPLAVAQDYWLPPVIAYVEEQPAAAPLFPAPGELEEPTPTFDELVERLRRAESRLQALEANGKTDEEDEDDEEELPEPKPARDEPEEKKWYEKYGIRGYTQFRINEAFHLAPDSAPPHHVGDASVSDNHNFFIRRARLILFGDVSDHMYIYFQPDFSITPPGSSDATHFVQLRDWYADIYCDKEKVYRFRVGQSKVPYGWENLQSSQQRLPLDRNDALNSAVRNERDLGVFFYWTPEYAQDLFRFIMDEGMKGSGNYGLWGLGVYNGQGGSLLEQNDNVHVVSRFTYPFVLYNGQIVELGAQAYTGRYVVLSTPISPLGVGPPVRPLGTLETDDRRGHRDERVAWTAVYYPQPFGLQAEWTVGRGPALNETQTAIEERSLHGGYLMAMYRYRTCHYGEWWPFVRWSYFNGGYKTERNAPFSRIEELELGVEWQINPQMEFVTMYTITDRTNTRAINEPDELSYRQFDGHILRFQFQINY